MARRLSKKIEKLVQQYVDRLEREGGLRINEAYVYGSQVKGTARKDSDIDVCVISSNFHDPLSALQWLFKQRTEQEVASGLEPIGFSKDWLTQGGILAEEVKRTGIKIR